MTEKQCSWCNKKVSKYYWETFCSMKCIDEHNDAQEAKEGWDYKEEGPRESK